MNTGVRQLTQEDHESNHPYRVGALVSLPALKDIPAKYCPIIPESWILNQQETEPSNDECGGCALAVISGLQEGTPLDPHFHWMMARVRAGEKLEDFGVNNRDLAMTAIKIGSLKRIQSPYTFQTPRDVIADSTKWDIPKLLPLAKGQIKGSVVWIKPEGEYDAFDVFRASVTKFNGMYGKPHGAVFGMMYNYTNSDINEPVEQGTGHDVALIGWDGDYAIMVNSLGLSAGVRGKFRVHRSVINRWAEPFGCFMPLDASQEQIKFAVEQGGKLDSYWFTNIIIALLNAVIGLKKQILKQT